jgi:hypothetical protein
MVQYALEQYVFLHDNYMKLGPARKCQRKFIHKFPSRQIIHNLVNKLDKKQKLKHQVLTEEKLHDIGARLEHTPRKSLKRLAQETGVSMSSARRATQWLKLRHYKTAVIHILQPHNPASRVHFSSWFLQSVVTGGINLQLTFFSDAAWFHLHGYINMLNNCYWSSQNLHITQEVLLHPVKVGVWYVVSARRIVGPMFFNETINCERYVQVIIRQFFSELTKERLYGWFQQDTATAHTAHTHLCRLCPVSSGIEFSAVVFGQHIHLFVIFIIFMGLFEGQSLQQLPPNGRTKRKYL